MKAFFDVQQGSLDWLALRTGIPTASEFENIITPTGLQSKSSAYVLRLATEILIGRPMESLEHSEHIQRGREREPEAIAAYEFAQGVRTKTIGFALTDDGQAGASPDRLVDDDGLLEVKCPSWQVQVGYIVAHAKGELGFEKEYKPQVQAQLFVTGRRWVDFYSWNPDLPEVHARVLRDEAYIEKMERFLAAFIARRDEMVSIVRAAGEVTPRPERVPAPVDQAYANFDWSRETLP